jgi:hypothetical protein
MCEGAGAGEPVLRHSSGTRVPDVPTSYQRTPSDAFDVGDTLNGVDGDLEVSHRCLGSACGPPNRDQGKGDANLDDSAEIRETLASLKVVEKSFEFWNNPADDTFDRL